MVLIFDILYYLLLLSRYYNYLEVCRDETPYRYSLTRGNLSKHASSAVLCFRLASWLLLSVSGGPGRRITILFV